MDKKRVIILVVIIALFVAVVGVAIAWPPGIHLSLHKGALLEPYEKGKGFESCSQLDGDFQSISDRWWIPSFFFAILAPFLNLAGGFLGGGKDTDKMSRKMLGVGLATAGTVFGGIAVYATARASAAASAAATVTEALTESSDKKAYDRCAATRASWLRSRVDSLEAFVKPPSGSPAPPVEPAAANLSGEAPAHAPVDTSAAPPPAPATAPVSVLPAPQTPPTASPGGKK